MDDNMVMAWLCSTPCSVLNIQISSMNVLCHANCSISFRSISWHFLVDFGCRGIRKDFQYKHLKPLKADKLPSSKQPRFSSVMIFLLDPLQFLPRFTYHFQKLTVLEEPQFGCIDLSTKLLLTSTLFGCNVKHLAFVISPWLLFMIAVKKQ